MAAKTFEQVAADRALAILFAQASGQRVLGAEVHAGAQALADSHRRTAERLNQLAKRASEIWADADRIAACAARSNGEAP